MPRQSRERTDGVGSPCTSLSANKNPTMPIGMLIRKIHRHVANVAIAPPNAGAMTGAASAGQVSSAMARTRSDLSEYRNTASRPTGTIIAPPMPCSTRMPTSIGSDTLAAHPIEAIVKTAIAVMNTRRTPNRSAIHPVAGISTATVTR